MVIRSKKPCRGLGSSGGPRHRRRHRRPSREALLLIVAIWIRYKVRKGGLGNRYPCNFPLVPGWDVAGVVEATGPAVPEFSEGDEVTGYVRRNHIQWGTYAELVPAPVRALTAKPPSLSWAEAATLPLAGLTAWQVLTRALDVGKEDVVLIHAAAGGVGTFAVQLAQVLGARVVGTASKANFGHLRALGAEPVAYRRRADRARACPHPRRRHRCPRPRGGRCPGGVERPARRRRAVGVGHRRGAGARVGRDLLVVRPDAEDLAALGRLVEEGRLNVHVERIFPLEGAADAHRLLEAGHMRGKLALSID